MIALSSALYHKLGCPCENLYIKNEFSFNSLLIVILSLHPQHVNFVSLVILHPKLIVQLCALCLVQSFRSRLELILLSRGLQFLGLAGVVFLFHLEIAPGIHVLSKTLSCKRSTEWEWEWTLLVSTKR